MWMSFEFLERRWKEAFSRSPEPRLSKDVGQDLLSSKLINLLSYWRRGWDSKARYHPQLIDFSKLIHVYLDLSKLLSTILKRGSPTS
jgi:hypothetical protein